MGSKPDRLDPPSPIPSPLDKILDITSCVCNGGNCINCCTALVPHISPISIHSCKPFCDTGVGSKLKIDPPCEGLACSSDPDNRTA